ncbi:MAG: hypothetical protein ACK47B_21710 [Armatimonadota bacterium]
MSQTGKCVDCGETFQETVRYPRHQDPVCPDCYAGGAEQERARLRAEVATLDDAEIAARLAGFWAEMALDEDLALMLQHERERRVIERGEWPQRRGRTA